MSWTWEHDDDEGFDGHDHEDDESPIVVACAFGQGPTPLKLRA